MLANILIASLALTGSSAATVLSRQTTLALGDQCDPKASACPAGSSCYASNSGLIPRCGNFNAPCTSDANCAYNACNTANGICSGPEKATTTTTTSAIPSPSATTTGSTPALGDQCDPKASNCPDGSSCYASNSGLIPRCGNFNAPCKSDANCAYNACNTANGLCSGPEKATTTASATSTPSATTASSTPALGDQCDPKASNCPDGSSCYASNSGLIPRCGNFNAPCKSDANCAYNACNTASGLCSGAEKSSTTAGSTASQTATASGSTSAQSTQPTVVADPHTLGLGALCSTSDQCATGVQCFASNVLKAKVCGGFNAACTLDSQCAGGVTCKGGICSGNPSTGSSSAGSSSAATTAAAGAPAASTTSASAPANGTKGGSSTTAPVAFTGDAAAKVISGSLLAGAAIVFAFGL